MDWNKCSIRGEIASIVFMKILCVVHVNLCNSSKSMQTKLCPFMLRSTRSMTSCICFKMSINKSIFWHCSNRLCVCIIIVTVHFFQENNPTQNLSAEWLRCISCYPTWHNSSENNSRKRKSTFHMATTSGFHFRHSFVHSWCYGWVFP